MNERGNRTIAIQLPAQVDDYLTLRAKRNHRSKRGELISILENLYTDEASTLAGADLMGPGSLPMPGDFDIGEDGAGKPAKPKK